ncbi:MAG: PAS domain S-box protein [Gammaproteobacteria bacterium]|nr:PAS domain S-box protein [Gammaproteobacteria bacterium]NNJ80309.1 PAS domain S-box protein [Xanthomonadales bacterium]
MNASSDDHGSPDRNANSSSSEKELQGRYSDYLTQLRAELLALTITDIENENRKREFETEGDSQADWVEETESNVRIRLKEIEDQNYEITTRRRLQTQVHEHLLKLRDWENRYQALIEQSTDLIWETDDQGRFIWLGPNSQEILGRPPRDLIGKPLFSQVGKSHCCRESALYEGAVKKRESFRNLVKRQVREDGQTVVMEFSGNPVNDAQGDFKGYLGVARDITERFHYQEVLEKRVVQRTASLKRSETRLKEAQKIAQLGNWEFDFERNRLKWSSGVYRLLEVDESLCELSYQDYFTCVYPDDRERLAETLMMAFENNETFDSVHRINLQDGQLKYIRAIGGAEHDDDANPVRLIGTVQDVTEQKLFEQELKKNLADMKRFEKMAVGRERRMVELKKEINELLMEVGRPRKYQCID